jgi:hypothetical protein
MDASGRRARIWILRGLLAAPVGCVAWGCSFQDFGYLTKGVATASDAGVDGDLRDGSFADAIDGADEADVSAAADDATSDGAADAVAEAGGPVNLLSNPNFDEAYSSWTFDPPAAMGTLAFIQPPVGSAITPQGQAYELATYSMNTAFTVDVSQTLTNLPDGDYVFTGWFNRGNDNQTYLYAKDCDARDGGTTLQADIPITTPTGWVSISITGIHVSGGRCQVGFFVDAAATDWLNADGFTFERLPGADPGDAGAD